MPIGPTFNYPDFKLQASSKIQVFAYLVYDQGDPPFGAGLSDWGFAEQGPFYHEKTPGNWTIYFPVKGIRSGTTAFSILKSTDGGQNWFQVSGSPQPWILGGNDQSWGCHEFGSTIRFYYWDNNGYVSSIDFDMATETWSSIDTSTEQISGTGTWGGIFGVRRSDGSDVIFWQGEDDPGPIPTTRYVIRNGVGNWGTSAEVEPIAPVSYRTVGLLLGNNDRVFFFYRNTDSIYCKALTPSDVLKSHQQMTQPGFKLFYHSFYQDSEDNYPFGPGALVGDSIYMPLTYDWDINDNIPALCVHSADDPASGDPEADTPSWVSDWTATVVSDRRTADYGADSYTQMAVRNVNGVPWVIWVSDITWEGVVEMPNSIFLSKFVDGEWTTPPDEVLLPAHDPNTIGGAQSHDSYRSLMVGVHPGKNQIGFTFNRDRPSGNFYMETTPDEDTAGGNYVY
jgi:hypothetical protein